MNMNDQNLEDFTVTPAIRGGLSPFSGPGKGPRGNFSRRPQHHPHRFKYPRRFNPNWSHIWGGDYWRLQPQYVVQPLLVYPQCNCITHSEHPTSINYNPNLANNDCDPNHPIEPCFCYSTCPDRFGNLDRQWYNCSAPDRGGLGSGSTVCRFRE